MKQRPDDSRETVEIAELRELVRALAGQVDGLTRENAALRAENQHLKDEIARLIPTDTGLDLCPLVERDGASGARGHRIYPMSLDAPESLEIDESISRAFGMKRLPPRPPFAPSGMEKASVSPPQAPSASRRRGPKRDRATREVIVRAAAPAGSRFKGYATLLVRELTMSADVIAYRRERWLTPQGVMVTAPAPAGIVGGFGPNLRQFYLVMHSQGQVTTERLTAILNGVGVAISKRQVVRLLTGGLDAFIAEDQAVLKAGLATAPFITVDDTGAPHQRRDNVTAQIAGEHAWLMHLPGLSLDVFDRTLVRILSEGALWCAVRAQGLMRDTVVISDDAGQFRVADHALCWGHTERLMQKLMPATARQEKAVKTVRDRVWKLYRALKRWKAQPVPDAAGALAACFDKIFAVRTGFPDLDRLLARLHRRKASLLRVLQRSEIPLHANGSENDLSACVTKRKISGGAMSADGRQARDVMLGLMKTCRKLDLSFFTYLGARLGCGDPAHSMPPLASLVA